MHMQECSLNKQDPTAKFLMETRYHVRRVKALRNLSKGGHLLSHTFSSNHHLLVKIIRAAISLIKPYFNLNIRLFLQKCRLDFSFP